MLYADDARIDYAEALVAARHALAGLEHCASLITSGQPQRIPDAIEHVRVIVNSARSLAKWCENIVTDQ